MSVGCRHRSSMAVQICTTQNPAPSTCLHGFRLHAYHVRRQITADKDLRELEQSTSEQAKSLLPRCISPRTPPSGTLVVLVLFCLLAEPEALGIVARRVVCEFRHDPFHVSCTRVSRLCRDRKWKPQALYYLCWDVQGISVVA